MSERNELLYAVQNGMSDIDNWPDDVGYKLLGVNMSKPQNAVVDAVLAAGYRKPRTITTAEELDALASGSVVLDPIGISLHKNAFTGWGASNGAKEIPLDVLAREALPATVLYEPTA